MENVMTKGFAELSATEIEEVNGGGAKAFAAALAGTIGVAWSPVVGSLAGPSNGWKVFKVGSKLLHYACDNPNK